MGEGKGGDEFVGACKRRHGDGSDLNFYLLLSHSSPLLSLSLFVPLVACSLLCPPNQMKERRDARERKRKKWSERGERENVLVYFPSFSFAEFVLLCRPFYILYLALPSYYLSCPCPFFMPCLSITA